MKLEQLQDVARRLTALVSDPQPGLMSWSMTLGELLQEIAKGTGYLKSWRDEPPTEQEIADPKIIGWLRRRKIGGLEAVMRDDRGTGNMITAIDFEGRKALVMALPDPIRGVLAIAECMTEGCTWTMAVTCDHPEPRTDQCVFQHREEVEVALAAHPCGKARTVLREDHDAYGPESFGGDEYRREE